LFCFFFPSTCSIGLFSLSLHDALPIFSQFAFGMVRLECVTVMKIVAARFFDQELLTVGGAKSLGIAAGSDVGVAPHDTHFPIIRSEEHTSELQSRENLVCRLLLEKKKK